MISLVRVFTQQKFESFCFKFLTFIKDDERVFAVKAPQNMRLQSLKLVNSLKSIFHISYKKRPVSRIEYKLL